MPSRITPRLDAGHMQTYQILAPLETHWRPATCEEVACPQAERGWKMRIDLSTGLGQRQAHYIKHLSGRKYTSEKVGDQLFELTFSSGQPCFQQHKARLDREERYIVRGGDHRGNPSGRPTRTHSRPEHWVEDMQENSDRINRINQRG